MEQWFYNPAALAHFMRALEPGIEASVKRAVADIIERQQHREEPMGIKEAAKYLGLKPGSLYVLCHKRMVPHSKVGKRLYFLKSQLDAWIQNGRRMTQSEIADKARRTSK